MDSTRQAMAVPTHIKSYGLDNAFSGHEQVFSAPKLVPKKGGKKGFHSPLEKLEESLTSFEQKHRILSKLVAEIGERFEELGQFFLDCAKR